MPTELVFARLPSLVSAYARVLLGRRRGRPGKPADIPEVTARVRDVRIDRAALRRYREVCGFDPGTRVPATYPQVLASGLLARMLVHPVFPLPLLGVVHLRSVITAERALDEAERLDIDCAVGAHKEGERGLELDLLTQVSSGCQRVWSAVTTVLWRRPQHSEKTRLHLVAHHAPPAGGVRWDLDADLGRRYARVSHDYNPIHLYALTAKLFGFARPIVHGLWSLGHALAALEGTLPAAPHRIEVDFKKPILLPASVRFVSTREAAGVSFEVVTLDSQKTHLSGAVRRP